MGREDFAVESRKFGKYLRRIREERRLSLDAVEEMTLGYPERVTKSHLSRIENGQAIPTFPRMFALSQVYGVPISSMAEEFEVDLRRKMMPKGVEGKTESDLFELCKDLRVRGRFADALVIFDLLIEQSLIEEASGLDIAELRFGRISCLIHLARYASAREECETLMSASGLTQKQSAKALQLFSMCCYRLGKFSIALITIDKAERDLEKIADAGELAGHLLTLKGNLLFLTGCYREAIDPYTRAIKIYEAESVPFEACRARLNLTSTHIELGNYKTARELLQRVLREAETQRYDRHMALALSNLALVSFRNGDLAAAETYCIRSNTLARPRDYVSVVFRNCFYLMKIARSKGDPAAIKTNERTLKAYFGRVEEYLPEAEEYRQSLLGGVA